MSQSDLLAVLQRIANARVKIAGGKASGVPNDASVEQIATALETEADLIVAGGSAASLSAVVARLERALASALDRDVGSVGSLGEHPDLELLTGRLEQLVTFLPNSGHHEQAPDAPASKPVMLTPVALATPAPTAAAAPVDNSAAEKAAADAAAAERAKAAADAAAEQAKAEAAAAAAAAEKAKAEQAAADKAKAEAAEAEKQKAEAAAAADKAKADADAKAKAAEKAKADAAASASAAASKPAPAVVEAAAPGGATVAASAAPSAASGPVGQTYSYEQLKGTKIDGVNWAEREQRLSDEDFLTVFKITRAEFNGLAGWKRQEKKKAVGLF